MPGQGVPTRDYFLVQFKTVIVKLVASEKILTREAWREDMQQTM
jgi:hypothetical protein